MTFQDFLNQFGEHEQFTGASLEVNSEGDFSESGNEYTPGMPEYLLNIQLISSGGANITLQFEGDDLDEIMNHAEDLANLICITSTIR